MNEMNVIDRIDRADKCGQITSTGHIINSFGEKIKVLSKSGQSRKAKQIALMKAALKSGVDW
jgi:hypothetical protein